MRRLYRTRFVPDALDVPAATMVEADRGRVGMNILPVMNYHDISDGAPRETHTYLVEQLSAFNLTYLHVAPIEAKVDYHTLLRPRFRSVYLVGCGLDQNSADTLPDSGPADAAVFGSACLVNPDLPERIHQGATRSATRPTRRCSSPPGEGGYTD